MAKSFVIDQHEMTWEIFNCFPLGIFVADSHGHFIAVNDAWTKMTNISSENAIGEGWLAAVHSDDRNRVAKRWNEKICQQAPFTMKYRLVDNSGKTFWCSMTVNPIGEGQASPIFLGIIKEATELHRFDKFSEEFFQSSFELLSIIGLDGYLRKVNPSWQQLLGYTQEELASKRLLDFIHPDDREKSLEQFKGISESKKVIDFVNRVQLKSGTYRWISWNAIFVKESGLIYAILHDITQQRFSESAFKLIYDLTQHIVKSETFSEAIAQVLELTCRRFGWEIGQLWTIDPREQKLFLQDQWFEPGNQKYKEFCKKSKSFAFGKGIGLPGSVWESQHPALIADLNSDKRILRSEAIKKAELKSAIAFHIRTQKEIFAIVEFFTRDFLEPNLPMLNLLDSIGYQLGEFILRKEAEQKINWLASIVKSSQNAIIGNDLKGNILSWNEGATRLLQHTREAMMGRSSFLLYPLEKRQEMEHIYRRVIVGETIDNLETTCLAAERIVDVSLTISPINDQHGNVIGSAIIATDITKRKQAEAELRRMHALQQAILDSSIYMVISTDLDGVIQIFNKSAERGLGYSADEIVGKLTPVIFHDFNEVKKRANVLSKELGIPVSIGFETFVAKAKLGLPDENEWTYIRKNGSRFSVMLCVTALFNAQKEITGYVGVVRDISERKQFQKTIKESEERFQVLFENATDSIITVDKYGIIHSFNRASENIFHYFLRDICGKNVQLLVVNSDFVHFEPLFQNASKESKFTGISKEIFCVRKNGEVFPAEVSVSQMIVDDDPWFIWVTRDITERKKLDRMKNEFVSAVSHELRTPLTSIKGSLGLILGGQSGDVSKESEKLLEIALRNSDRLLGLINDILDLDKIESGSLDFKIEKHNLSDLIDIVIENNRPFADQYHVEIIRRQSDEFFPVRVDSNRLLQAMTNLLSNAIKFSPPGEKVIVYAEKKEDKVRFNIMDHGPGIPLTFHERIFQKFAQGDGSDKRLRGGTGLGLSITKMIIEKFGGTIDFISEEGKGSTFYFDLPLGK